MITRPFKNASIDWFVSSFVRPWLRQMLTMSQNFALIVGVERCRECLQTDYHTQKKKEAKRKESREIKVLTERRQKQITSKTETDNLKLKLQDGGSRSTLQRLRVQQKQISTVIHRTLFMLFTTLPQLCIKIYSKRPQEEESDARVMFHVYLNGQESLFCSCKK